MTLSQHLKWLLCLLFLCISHPINNQAISLAKYIKKPSESDIRCLAANLYHEARGEGTIGMLLVANVVVNRMVAKELSACRVIMEPRQFSWFRRLLRFDFVEGEPRDIAIKVLTEHENGVREDLTDGAMWYHTIYTKPDWAKKLQITKRYKKHIFYKERT